MKSILYGVLVFGLILVGTVWGTKSVWAAQDIGVVSGARGQTTALQQASPRSLSINSAIWFQDQLRTGPASRLKVTFVDGTQLALGDRSELNIDEMVYEPGQRGNAVLSLARGVFRMVSGHVNKVPGGQMTLKTPIATIGVRGTDFWGEQSADQLKMALLDDGELTITTDQGTVVLTDPLSAVVIRKGKTPSDLFMLTPQQVKEAMATVDW